MVPYCHVNSTSGYNISRVRKGKKNVSQTQSKFKTSAVRTIYWGSKLVRHWVREYDFCHIYLARICIWVMEKILKYNHKKSHISQSSWLDIVTFWLCLFILYTFIYFCVCRRYKTLLYILGLLVTCYVEGAGLELVVMLLPWSLRCWDYKHMLPCPVLALFRCFLLEMIRLELK